MELLFSLRWIANRRIALIRVHPYMEFNGVLISANRDRWYYQ